MKQTEKLKKHGTNYFNDYSQLDNILFVNASRAKEIVKKQDM
ncbi:hypothetical protein [Anaerophaga thermohalophila]|nr:hypothetical protein [Anaerophaga thermohalophila]